MSHTSRVACVVSTVLMVALLGASVAAAEPADHDPSHDGLYARLWSGDRRALIVVEAGTGNDRLSWAISGLLASTEYRIVGSTADCDEPVTSANRTFRHRIDSSAAGRSFGIVAGNFIGTDVTGTVRIAGPSGGVWKCGISINYTKVGGASAALGPGQEPDAAFARFGTRGFVLIELLDATSARVTIALRGLMAGHDYAVVGRDGTCQGTAGQRHYRVTFEDVLVSSFRSRQAEIAAEDLAATRSTRVQDGTLIEEWGCRRQQIIAVLVA